MADRDLATATRETTARAVAAVDLSSVDRSDLLVWVLDVDEAHKLASSWTAWIEVQQLDRSWRRVCGLHWRGRDRLDGAGRLWCGTPATPLTGQRVRVSLASAPRAHGGTLRVVDESRWLEAQ